MTNIVCFGLLLITDTIDKSLHCKLYEMLNYFILMQKREARQNMFHTQVKIEYNPYRSNSIGKNSSVFSRMRFKHPFPSQCEILPEDINERCLIQHSGVVKVIKHHFLQRKTSLKARISLINTLRALHPQFQC